MNPAWRWGVFALLGAYHGLNPAMGWLFALALGLQEKRRTAVVRALLPIALGHALSIAVAIVILGFLQHLLSMDVLKWPIAALIFTLGVYRLFRSGHPRGAGIRVGGRDLIVWSFLMASAHGAGLMLIPVLWSHPTAAMHHKMFGAMGASGTQLTASVAVTAILVHTVAMLAVAGILALACFELYERVGLKVLQYTWINFDLLWAVALLVASVAVLFS